MKRNSKRFLALFMAVSMSVTPTTVLHAEENSETDQIQNVEIKQDENIAQEDSETNEKSNSAENSKEEIGKNEQAEVKDTQDNVPVKEEPVSDNTNQENVQENGNQNITSNVEKNDKKNQEKEVTSHYDIGNDFYKLWLDETMSYSCGYFIHEDDTLYQAQVNKVDYILKKLHLEEGMSLLDIGCGWGFLLIEAAKKYKVHGTGIALSHEQYAEFQRRIKDQGLEDYLTVELMDYRDLPKKEYQFDRVVSVGMLEHVGRDNYQLFLDCVEKVLKPGGLFLLHFISALKEHPGDPWVKKYIFPGGTVPSLREILNHMAEDNFHTLDIENLRLHYNKTLLHWEKNFRDNIEKEKTMFDEEFLRMWDLYLSACAATFHNGIIDLHQILMTKGVNNDLPMTRWY